MLCNYTSNSINTSYFQLCVCDLWWLTICTSDIVRGGVPSVEPFLRNPNPCLCNIIQRSNKTMDNSKRLCRRARLGYNLAPPIYQFQKYNLSATGETNFQLNERNNWNASDLQIISSKCICHRITNTYIFSDIFTRFVSIIFWKSLHSISSLSQNYAFVIE